MLLDMTNDSARVRKFLHPKQVLVHRVHTIKESVVGDQGPCIGYSERRKGRSGSSAKEEASLLHKTQATSSIVESRLLTR